MLAHALLAFLFLQLPQNDTIPQKVICHTTLLREVFRNLSFYRHHSGYYIDSKDRLRSEMKIVKGLRFLKSMFQDIFLRLIIVAACSSGARPVLYKNSDCALIKGQVVHV